MKREVVLTRRHLLSGTIGMVGALSNKQVLGSEIDSKAYNNVFAQGELEPVKELPEFQSGMCYLEYGFEGQDEGLDIYRKETGLVLDRLVKNNINTVSYVFPLFQDSWTSTTVYPDPIKTPSTKTMEAFISEAQKRKLAVMLRPIIDESAIIADPTPSDVDKWRGNIQPTDPSAWFASYGNEIVNIAKIAQRTGVESLSIGAELNSMEQYTSHWKEMLHNIEKVYSGEKVYAMNWGALYHGTTNPELLIAVDRVGIDAFYPHDLPEGASEEQIQKSWEKFGLIEIELMEIITGKKPFLAEIGVRSQDGSYRQPFVWNDPTEEVNEDDQATFFQATCDKVLPQVSGWFVWAVGRNSLGVDPKIDETFDPTNKKSEKVIADCNEQIIFSEQ